MYGSATLFVALAYETCGFLANSWRLSQNSFAASHSGHPDLRSFFSGKYLPAFSRSLLRSGQQYYLYAFPTRAVTLVLKSI